MRQIQFSIFQFTYTCDHHEFALLRKALPFRSDHKLLNGNLRIFQEIIFLVDMNIFQLSFNSYWIFDIFCVLLLSFVVFVFIVCFFLCFFFCFGQGENVLFISQEQTYQENSKQSINLSTPINIRLPRHESYYAHLLTLCLFSAPRMGYNHQYAPYFLSEYSGQSANVSRVLDTLLHGYDKRLRPKYKGRWRDVISMDLL